MVGIGRKGEELPASKAFELVSQDISGPPLLK